MTENEGVLLRFATDGLDLTSRQGGILLLCRMRDESKEDRQVKTIAAKMGWAKPVISRAADKMVDMGLLSRSQLPDDRRSCVITITKKGRALLQLILDGKGAETPEHRRRVKGAAAAE